MYDTNRLKRKRVNSENIVLFNFYPGCQSDVSTQGCHHRSWLRWPGRRCPAAGPPRPGGGHHPGGCRGRGGGAGAQRAAARGRAQSGAGRTVDTRPGGQRGPRHRRGPRVPGHRCWRGGGGAALRARGRLHPQREGGSSGRGQ